MALSHGAADAAPECGSEVLAQGCSYADGRLHPSACWELEA